MADARQKKRRDAAGAPQAPKRLSEIVLEGDRLEACCAAWRARGRFAFDTEFIRDDTYEPELCLIQVNAGDGVVLIDPLGGMDLACFWELVYDPEVTTIVHAGKEDFELCLRKTGRTPRNVFDVQIGAGFVGLGYPLRLSRLVGTVLNKRIAKGQTLTDWLRRPLTDGQLRYAVEDVAYLPQIYDQLTEQLTARDRTRWADEEFRRYEDAHFYRPPTEQRLFKLKGSRQLDGLGLMILQLLVDWRDQWAERKNRPIRALARDDVLVSIAKRRPERAADLQVLRGFPQANNARVIQEILDIIEAARKTPRETWPTPHETRDDTPLIKAALDILSAYTRVTCHEEEIGQDLVGGAQRLRELLHYSLDGDVGDCPTLLAGWREEFIGRRLVDLIEGRCELHLSGWPDQLHLEVVPHPNSTSPD